VCCQVERSLRRIDHSSRGALPTVARRCVWSRNIEKRGGYSPLPGCENTTTMGCNVRKRDKQQTYIWPINTSCTTADRERFSVFKWDHWVQKSVHLWCTPSLCWIDTVWNRDIVSTLDICQNTHTHTTLAPSWTPSITKLTTLHVHMALCNYCVLLLRNWASCLWVRINGKLIASICYCGQQSNETGIRIIRFFFNYIGWFVEYVAQMYLIQRLNCGLRCIKKWDSTFKWDIPVVLQSRWII
jgi:hypothetical protein